MSTVDISPTILDMAGIRIPPEMEGISQKALLLGDTVQIRSAVIIENRAVEQGFYQKMIVRDNYKAVYYYGQSYGELFDLSKDPDQYHNLWDDPAYQTLKREMLYQLYEKSVIEESAQGFSFTVPQLLQMLDKQIDQEGPVQKRTSFS
jgi:arylsulfatase A-like enzyme